jgi:hypothetical protein
MEIIFYISIGIVVLLVLLFIFRNRVSKIYLSIPFFKAGIENFPKEKKSLENDRRRNFDRRASIFNQININSEKKPLDPEQTKIIAPMEITHYKEYAKILFIDDLDWTDKIKNLQDAGWKNVSQITNPQNLDRIEIREANIIFVDYKGVGKNLKDEGVDVIYALKKRYGDNKWIILYSAQPSVPISATSDKKPDASLAKNSSAYEFEQKILEGLGRIKI